MFVKGTELAENFLSHQISGDLFFVFFAKVNGKNCDDAGSSSCEMTCFFFFQTKTKSIPNWNKKYSKNVISLGYCMKARSGIKSEHFVSVDAVQKGVSLALLYLLSLLRSLVCLKHNNQWFTNCKKKNAIFL